MYDMIMRPMFQPILSKILNICPLSDPCGFLCWQPSTPEMSVDILIYRDCDNPLYLAL